MKSAFANLLDSILARAEAYGIRVQAKALGPETPGTFDGLALTYNPDYPAEELCFYLAHAVGSMVEWSRDPKGCEAIFDELDAAKAERDRDPGRLDRALEDWRAYEVEASRYAVWLLDDLGKAAFIPAYNNFAHADLEAVTRFHRTGQAPVWREFFAHWNDEVAAGRREIPSFDPLEIPSSFRPVPMRKQEIVQEVDGKS